jgi:hypothetical protein
MLQNLCFAGRLVYRVRSGQPGRAGAADSSDYCIREVALEMGCASASLYRLGPDLHK